MNWPEYTLDEIGSISRGRSRHRPRDAAHLYGGNYPFIQTGDVKNAGLYLTDFEQTYSDAGLAQSKLWPEGTLCITIAANIAETSILKIEACFPDSIIGFIPDRDKSDARYVKYLFDAAFRKKFKAFTQGTAQDNLSQTKLLSLKFPIPDLPIQQCIADILSHYDDLIENNKRRIVLLEESARQLYKEWFIRFRFPGNKHVNIIDGLPEGWKKKSVKDVATLHYGKALKADTRIPGPFAVFGSSGIVGSHNKPLAKGPGIIVGRKGNVGSIYWSYGDFYPIDTVYFINSDQSSYFLYYALLNTRFINTDVAVPGLNRDFAYSREIIMPTPLLHDEFEREVDPLFNQIRTLRDWNAKLAEARDLLLPKLMSGEIAI